MKSSVELLGFFSNAWLEQLVLGTRLCYYAWNGSAPLNIKRGKTKGMVSWLATELLRTWIGHALSTSEVMESGPWLAADMLIASWFDSEPPITFIFIGIHTPARIGDGKCLFMSAKPNVIFESNFRSQRQKSRFNRRNPYNHAATELERKTKTRPERDEEEDRKVSDKWDLVRWQRCVKRLKQIPVALPRLTRWNEPPTSMPTACLC